MNEHLKEPLSNYIKQTDPSYALLITGEWGVGKTHTLINFLSKETVYYVSLYGLSSEGDIHSDVINAMHPEKKRLKHITEKFKGIDISALGFRVGVGTFLSEAINSSIKESIKKDKVIIFDDLERCQINLDITLGAINKYIEHHKCRVIVICNDKKIPLSKEKLFGLTLKVSPNINEAFQDFTKHKDFGLIKFKFKDLILDIFKTSQIQSLRILKHTINDCLQLYSILEDKHKNNENCMRELFSLFIAITLEVRNGELKEEDIRNRTEILNSFMFAKKKEYTLLSVDGVTHKPNKDDPLPKIKLISDKYLSIPFQSNIISNTDLINAIFNGNYNKEGIRNSINLTAYFLEEKSTPNWVIIYHFYNVDDEVLERAIAGLNKEFLNRTITISGDILHLFHIKFMMKYFNQISDSYVEIEKQCKAYIDDLYAVNKIEPIELNFDPYRDNRSYRGYGFWTQDEYKSNSDQVKEYLSEARKKTLYDQIPLIHENIIETLTTDIKKFVSVISYTDGQPGEYALFPILAGLSPEKFVQAWLSNSRAHWMKVSYALLHRYGEGRLQNVLADEKEWLKEVIQILKAHASNEVGFKNHCLDSLVTSPLNELASN